MSATASKSSSSMAFLKSFFRGYAKHKKLSEEWNLTPKKKEAEEEPGTGVEVAAGSALEGITFAVKYLGSSTVREPSSAKATADAINTIVSISKSSGRKTVEAQLAVNLRGITVLDLENNTQLMNVSLYRVSYCSADASHGHVFGFIAMGDNEKLECHAFLCPKRKIAQLISITVAQTFNTAFHLWQMTHTGSIPSSPGSEGSFFPSCVSGSKDDTRPSVLQTLIAPVPVLIDLTTPIEDKQSLNWTSFDD